MTTQIFEHFGSGWHHVLIAAANAAPAAKAAPAPTVDPLNLNWFDIIVVLLLAFGLYQGKKRGMSLELLDVFQWLLVVVIGSLYYAPLAQMLASLSGLSRLASNLMCYIGIAIVIKIAFSLIKKAVGEKLVGSDIFGRMEFYFGMMAGMLRYFCMVIVAMAIINAKAVNPKEIEDAKKKQQAELGSSFFPSFGEIQQDVLYKSMIGKTLREHLADQLISPYASSGTVTKPVSRESGPGRKREKALDDAVNDTPKDTSKEKK